MTRSGRRWLVAGALALLGCGDDAGELMPDGGELSMGDGGVEAGPPMDGGPLGDAATDGGADSCTLDRLLITTSDYATAVGATLDLETGEPHAGGTLEDQDSVPDLLGCTPIVLERERGTLLVQSAEDPLTTLRSLELDPEGRTDPYLTNPQAVVSIDARKAYVVATARNELLIVDPTADGASAVTGTIDLSGFLDPDDADGLVDAIDAIGVGDRVYVALANQWFDESFAIHFEGSVLAVIDSTRDELVDVDASSDGVQGIALASNNPWRGLWADEAGARLWVGTTGDSFALDGMIEEVDLDAHQSMGALIEEATVGAEINGFEVVSPDRVLLLAGAEVIAFDPGATFPTDPMSLAKDVDGMLLHDGALFTWAREGDAPGLRRFAAATGLETTPEDGPWTFGALPIYGVSPAP